MQLNKKNYFARYYSWIYEVYPNDLCSFFWGSLFAILMAPVLIPGKLFSIMTNSHDSRHAYVLQCIIGVFIYAVCAFIILIGNIILETCFGYVFIYFWATLVGGFAIGLTFFSLIALFVVGVVSVIVLFHEKHVYNNVLSTPIVQNMKDLIGAVRGKYCVKITWKS